VKIYLIKKLSLIFLLFILIGCSESPERYALLAGEQCLEDTKTGLVWELKTDDGGLRDKDHTYSWYNQFSNGGHPGWKDSYIGYSEGARVRYSYPEHTGETCDKTLDLCNTQDYLIAVNKQGLCGYKDWRMPSKQELYTLLDLTKSGCSEADGTMETGGCVNTSLLPDVAKDKNGNYGGYWSSSPHWNPRSAWAVYFYLGSYGAHFKYYYNYVRLVRSADHIVHKTQ